MNNAQLQLKVKQRLNKLASLDYDNIEAWQIQEAYNKAQLEWVRRQLHGNNATKEGDEATTRRIDDLQQLLTPHKLTGKQERVYFHSDRIPGDYMAYKRVSTQATSKCCPEPRIMQVYLVEEADADLLLIDNNSTPSFEWGETYCTLVGNHVRIYHNGKFDLVEPKLLYYRLPREVKFKGSMDPETGKYVVDDIEPEFKNDIVELIIDDTVSILAGDIESITQFQRTLQNAERNN